ncbi:MAG: arginine--tRNA ligase, partial [Verrucomicrobiota bacterium]|nr:arginine--tRNA ligase [Verrucomicrobiota bacterium]
MPLIMPVWFNPSHTIDQALREVAGQTPGFGLGFDPEVRPADPRFGDFQANGVLSFAKENGMDPRELGQLLIDAAQASNHFDP